MNSQVISHMLDSEIVNKYLILIYMKDSGNNGTAVTEG